jgi:hypothetical protein
VTTRDKAILGVLGVFGLFAAFWFLGLSPKRSELKKLDTQVEASKQEVAAARGEADQFAKDRLAFPRAYTTMVRLGKAVPSDADVPSLIVQLEHAAAEAHVDFRTVKLEVGEGSSSSTSAAPPPPPTPSAGSTSGGATPGATGQSGSQGGAAGSTGTTGASSATSTSSSSTAGSSAPLTAAPANATAAATLPIGAEVGDAQLPLMRFNLIFQGSFFKMADLIHNIRELVRRQDRQLLVSGRLLTLDGFVLEQGDFGFPQVKATMAATAYLLPVSQGLLNGANAQGPAGATPTTATPVSTSASPSTPPAAVVTRP